MSTVWTVVVAAGSGNRFGAPKQYEELGGRRLLDWALHAALAVSQGVVLVVAPDHAQRAEPAVDAVVVGGATRSASVRAGLAAVPPEAEIIVVHDAARPLASVNLFERVVDAVRQGADAAVPSVPVTDTVKEVEPATGTVRTVDRDRLVAVQTPQAFAAVVLRRAHAAEPEASDDAALVEELGGNVALVDGEAHNLKVTHPHDLATARAIFAAGPQ